MIHFRAVSRAPVFAVCYFHANSARTSPTMGNFVTCWVILLPDMVFHIFPDEKFVKRRASRATHQVCVQNLHDAPCLPTSVEP